MVKGNLIECLMDMAQVDYIANDTLCARMGRLVRERYSWNGVDALFLCDVSDICLTTCENCPLLMNNRGNWIRQLADERKPD